MTGKVWIVGIGPGNPDYLTPAALKVIERSDVLIGGKRNLEQYRREGQETLAFEGDYDRICDYIQQHAIMKQITILASGDPGIFSIQKVLRGKLVGIEMETIPGISALQYFCAKLGIGWDDLRIVSLHGRDDIDICREVRIQPRLGVFSGGKNTPDAIGRMLAAEGCGAVRMTVGERLSYPEERIVRGTAEEIGTQTFDNLAMIIIENDAVDLGQDNVSETINAPTMMTVMTSGLPDDCFIRGEAPMTKAEIRAISLSKLQLRSNDVVYDIGAGTGSVTVEAARVCQGGLVYAIEKDPQAVALIRENIKHFGLSNIRVIEGEAPGALEGLPEPDRVFIGGSDGRLADMMQRFRDCQKNLRVVINAITLETTYEAMLSLRDNGFIDIETITVSIARSQPAGVKHIMKALNPVTVISAVKGEQR